MLKILNYLIIISIALIVSGCANKIDFKNYNLVEYTNEIEVKKPINMNLENIEFKSLVNGINSDYLKTLSSYNEILNFKFNTSVKNKDYNIEIILDSIDNNVNYIEGYSYKYKGKDRWEEGYYEIITYAKIVMKIIKNKELIKIYKEESGIKERRYSIYRNKFNYKEPINRTLDKLFYLLQEKIAEPFEIIKVLKEKESKEKRKIAVLVNGGTCDGLNIGNKVKIFNQDLKYIGIGEVTNDSRCKKGWIKIEEYWSEPQIGSIIKIN
jgi:RNAse (barnase) inhibitor barstar